MSWNISKKIIKVLSFPAGKEQRLNISLFIFGKFYKNKIKSFFLSEFFDISFRFDNEVCLIILGIYSQTVWVFYGISTFIDYLTPNPFLYK